MSQGGSIQSPVAGRAETCPTLAAYILAVRRCAEAGEKVVDYGVAHRGLGHAPPPDHVRISAPTDTFEHWMADLSVRAPGGMSVGELQQRLGQSGQFLPLDADEDMTVAEVIVHNVSGPLRITHGTCRDLLLGLRYVDATGTLITVGGRTVKNVAGYDVTRLMVGSLNTLGLVADANLRTSAIPPQVTRVEIVGLDPAALDGLMTEMLTCDAAPYYMHSHGGILTVAYSGTPRGCDAQYAALRGWLGAKKLDSSSIDRIDGDLAGDAAARMESGAWRRRTAGHVQVIVPPAQTGKTVRVIADWAPAVDCIDALPAHGVIHIGGEWSIGEACEVDERIGTLLAPIGGLRVWHRRPGDTPRIAPFAPPQSDWAMLRRIKEAMDPEGMFNPGRFP